MRHSRHHKSLINLPKDVPTTKERLLSALGIFVIGALFGWFLAGAPL